MVGSMHAIWHRCAREQCAEIVRLVAGPQLQLRAMGSSSVVATVASPVLPSVETEESMRAVLGLGTDSMSLMPTFREKCSGWLACGELAGERHARRHSWQCREGTMDRGAGRGWESVSGA